MKPSSGPSTLTRVFAGLLAAIWIGAGVYIIAVAAAQKKWAMLIASPLAIGYGMVWVAVMLRGEQLRSGETLPTLKLLLAGNFRAIINPAPLAPRRRTKR